MYATAFAESSPVRSSTHSVEPSNPGASPSQLAMSTLRRGRLHRDLRERVDPIERQPLDAGLRRLVWSRRITRTPRQVHHAAALNHSPPAIRTIRIRDPLKISIVARIGK